MWHVKAKHRTQHVHVMPFEHVVNWYLYVYQERTFITVKNFNSTLKVET